MLRCTFADPSEPALESGLNRILGVRYGSSGCADGAGESWFDVANRVLGDGPKVEIWRQRSVHATRLPSASGDVADDDLLAGTMRSSFAGDLEEATRSHFAAILELAAARAHPHLVRIWNYVPSILAGDGDRERYRLFNAGRVRAFEERYGTAQVECHFPASSAVGTPGTELRSLFFASAVAPIHLENRRQVPASRYPRRYGPRPPSFRRATLLTGAAGRALFVSGTASIVGHTTRHAGSLVGQIDESLRNLDSILGEARRIAAWRIPPLREFALVKVYLRHADQYHVARARLAAELPAAATLYLEAEICRPDLLFEIEGVALP